MPKGALNMTATWFVKLVLLACNHISKLTHELGKMHELSLSLSTKESSITSFVLQLRIMGSLKGVVSGAEPGEVS
jgi:hypothetical protein